MRSSSARNRVSDLLRRKCLSHRETNGGSLQHNKPAVCGFVVCDVKNCENNINKVSVAFFDVQESPRAQHSMCNVIKEEGDAVM